MLERDVYCQECGQWFVATGNGGFVDCPFCGTNLELSYVVKDGEVVNERLYNQIGRPEYDATPMPKTVPKSKPFISIKQIPSTSSSCAPVGAQAQSGTPSSGASGTGTTQRPKQEQNIAPVVISALVVVAMFIGVVVFVCSNISKPKPAPQQDNSLPYYPESAGSDYSSSYNYNSNTQSESSSSSSSSSYTPSTPVMDAHEDAYEEARALSEEDHLNGTRSHEGDNYNGYDDDYDEGYDE